MAIQGLAAVKLVLQVGSLALGLAGYIYAKRLHGKSSSLVHLAEQAATSLRLAASSTASFLTSPAAVATYARQVSQFELACRQLSGSTEWSPVDLASLCVSLNASVNAAYSRALNLSFQRTDFGSR